MDETCCNDGNGLSFCQSPDICDEISQVVFAEPIAADYNKRQVIIFFRKEGQGPDEPVGAFIMG